MREHYTIAALALAACIVLGACTEGDAATSGASQNPHVTIQARTEASTGHFETSSGALARRQEAQADLDAARTALARQDARAAAAALHGASTFFLSHATVPAAAARDRLEAAAAGLDRLAAQLQAGGTVTAGALAQASGYANVADGEHHQGEAAGAWARRSNTTAGDELLMAIDHLERAHVDLERPMTTAERSELSTARATATSLMKDEAVAAGSVERALAAVERHLQMLDRPG